MIPIIEIKENSSVHFPACTLGSMHTQDPTKQPLKIEKEMATFGVPDAHTIGLDKMANFNQVIDSTDLHGLIYL